MPILNKAMQKRRKETASKAREKRQAMRKNLGETGQPRKQKVEKRSAAEVAKGQAHYKVTGEYAKKKAAALAAVKSAGGPARGTVTGKGGKTVGGKANVTKEQLKASGLTLTQYMNQWNKSGKRPTGSSGVLAKRPAPAAKKVEAKAGPNRQGVGTVLRESEGKSSKYAPNKQGAMWHKKSAKKAEDKSTRGAAASTTASKPKPAPKRGPKTMEESQADHRKYYKKPGAVFVSK